MDMDGRDVLGGMDPSPGTSRETTFVKSNSHEVTDATMTDKAYESFVDVCLESLCVMMTKKLKALRFACSTMSRSDDREQRKEPALMYPSQGNVV